MRVVSHLCEAWVAAPHPSGKYIALRARAELFGALGAGVLGAGLALLFRHYVAALAVPFVVLGGAVHALAMYEKHRLDMAGAVVMPRWTVWTYWICWVLLLGLVAYGWRLQS